MRIGIVGGGIAGLTAAHRLGQAGHAVAVFEKLATLGGQAGTFPIEGTRLEYYYHHLFQSDGAATALIKELGLGPDLAWLTSRMGYFHGGRVYDFVTPLDLLLFQPLPLPSRIVLGLQGVWLQVFGDWRKLERIPAKEWVLRWGGQRIYDVVWGALLRGKYGAYADQVSMAWLWGKVALRRSLKGSGVSRETLGYMMGSFQKLVDALERRILDKGGEIHTRAGVERVQIVDGAAKGLVTREDGGLVTRQFDAVILTVANPIVLSLVPELAQSSVDNMPLHSYAEMLASLPYQAAMVLVLKLNRSLSPIYWLNISDREMPFVAAIEHTNYVGPQHYGGAHILYLSNYLSTSDPLYQLGKEELLARYLPHIQRINPAFDRAWVEESWLFRDPYGQPVIGINYSQRIPAHSTPVAGLYLANTTQIYPEDRGINYSVRLGEVVSEIVQGRAARVSTRW